MLHAYFVFKKRLMKIQDKNQQFVAGLTERFPFLDRTPTNTGAAPSRVTTTTHASRQQQIREQQTSRGRATNGHTTRHLSANSESSLPDRRKKIAAAAASLNLPVYSLLDRDSDEE